MSIVVIVKINNRMTPEERKDNTHSHLDETTNAVNKNANLVRDLQKAGVGMSGLKGKRGC